MNWSIEILSRSVEETLEIGQAIGGALAPGDVLGLVGCLGAGKTHLIKGIAAGMGVGGRHRVTSPTFVLVNEYTGRLHVFHIDAYRLHSALELESLGFQEMCDSEGVVLVEWADRVNEAFGPDVIWIALTITGDAERRLVVRTRSVEAARRLGQAGLDR
jgi:tRNA threonylcarbamoyladenosine biosynthesis protein TsaE